MRPALLALRAAIAVLVTACAAAQTLGPGDPAPKLQVSTWVKGAPLISFERDHVYVVDFWATWCMPCLKTIPHLGELQQRYAERNVHVLGVSVYEDRQADVAPFVGRMGEQMGYTVATDLVLQGATSMQGAMVRTWLRPAGESSLPTTFIVDGSGKIAWIGDTLSVDKVLEQVVAGSWDLETARAEHLKRSKVNKLRAVLNDQIRHKQWEKALATIEEMRTLAPDTEAKTAAWRFSALLQLGRDEEAYGYARACVAALIKDDPLALNVIAWAIVDPDAPRRPSRDLDFALVVAERAVALTESKSPALLDTLALVHFERGAVAQAIEIQERAVALAEGHEYHAELLERLERFRRALRMSDISRNGDGGRVLVQGR